jgi:hypothetical protein
MTLQVLSYSTDNHSHYRGIQKKRTTIWFIIVVALRSGPHNANRV